MRSLLLRVLISVIMCLPAAQAQETLDLFVIEKPVESYDASQLSTYLAQSMSDLLVRMVGDIRFSETQEAKKYIQTARQWVQRFQLVNREIDGVIVGQSLRVEFDRDRLMAAFQEESLPIWPLNYRPNTLVVGQWEQRGLLENISQQSLAYRVDLDYRPYGRLLGLPMTLPADLGFFEQFDIVQLTQQERGLDEALLSALTHQAHYVLLYKADLIGEVVSWTWGLYSLETGQPLLRGQEVGESFLELIESTLSRLLDLYSTPYRQALGSLGLLEVEIQNVGDYEVLKQIEEALTRFRPTINEVRLTEVEGRHVRFEIIYNGQFSNLLDHLERLERVEWNDQGFFQGQLKGRYTQ